MINTELLANRQNWLSFGNYFILHDKCVNLMLILIFVSITIFNIMAFENTNEEIISHTWLQNETQESFKVLLHDAGNITLIF